MTPQALPQGQKRSAKLAVRRGLVCKCPACGEGKMFTSYLKVARACPSCGQELFHHRADDGPAYITMLIVCHIAGTLLHVLFTNTTLSPLALALVVVAIVAPLSLIMLPSAKGGLIGIQWANRMHGFGRGAQANI